MAELTVQMTYGKALYDAAKENGREKELLKEGKEVQKIFESEPDFFMLINDPTITGEEKKKLINNVFQKSLSKEMFNLFYVLIDKRRTHNFSQIIDEFQKLVNVEEGVSYGVVYSAVDLSLERLNELEEETGKLLRGKVRLRTEIDTSLIGGIKVLIEGKIIDASIRQRLESMESELVR